MRQRRVTKGSSAPLGATVMPGGVNFSVYSRDATLIELLLFDSVDDAEPSQVIPLRPDGHRSYHYYHAFVEGIGAGQIYGYRAHGPFLPHRGLRFDPEKVLVDPYGLLVLTPSAYSREAASRPGSNIREAMKSMVVDPRCYDWEGDMPLCTPSVRTVIYEMHVRGFTQHESSGVAPERRGTYAGLIEKIPYLKELGITAVELLPVFQFDPTDAPPGLTNYWGYQPVSFFAPHLPYSSRKDPLGALDEFRDMVKALHRAGIEVIVDVVFNHTTEGGEGGPTLSYRGLANNTYYILEENEPRRYKDFTGCGNTLNSNHSIVRRMIQDSLRYWVSEMHVDGFRFDLASVLSRDMSGHPVPHPAVIWDIESDPLLSGTKLIAEAWDAAGLYQLGSFVGDAWLEWNGKFRDDVRRFVRGDNKSVPAVAARIMGSPDIFVSEERDAEQSVNFVTCHDGFTANDLVSYNVKHNEANLENSRDGTDENLSWNCGVEGETDDPEINQLRERQLKNLALLTMISSGIPMILMGDEVRRTQRGNNNAYCQDNELSWFDWTLVEKNKGLHRFVSMLCQMRSAPHAEAFTPGPHLCDLIEETSIHWHGVKLGEPDWSDDSHSIAFELTGALGRYHLYCALNSYWEPLNFELPRVPAQPFRLCIDTSLPSPDDIRPLLIAPPYEQSHYVVGPRTFVLFARSLFLPDHPPSSHPF